MPTGSPEQYKYTGCGGGDTSLPCFMTGEKREDNKQFNIIVLTLTVAALSLWGSFSQLGEETNGQSVAHHCHLFETGFSQDELIATIVLIGLTLGYYGVNVEESSEDVLGNRMVRGILVVAHVLLVGFIWSMFDTLIDNRSSVCDEFSNRHNMFLCIALISIIVSLLYLLCDIAKKYAGNIGETLYNTFVYGLVTFAFFFYATAPAGSSAHAFTDPHQQAWTLGATGGVMVLHLLANSETLKDKAKFDPKTLKIVNKRYFKVSQGIVAVVLLNNWITSLVIVSEDINHVWQSTSSTKSSSSCLSEHDNVLGMQLTAVGYWTFYIILIGMALVQTIQRTMKEPDMYKVHGYAFSDTKKGWNMPTSIVALTYAWLLVAFIMHGADFYDDGCTASHWREMLVFAAHSVGFFVVCWYLPYKLAKSDKTKVVDREQTPASDSGGDASNAGGAGGAGGGVAQEVLLRPTNRFTTRAQVAVDVNTPLNFA